MSRLVIHFSIVRGACVSEDILHLSTQCLSSYHFLLVDGYFFCKVQCWEPISPRRPPPHHLPSACKHTLTSSSSASRLSSIQSLDSSFPSSCLISTFLHLTSLTLLSHQFLLPLPLISLRLCGGAITPASLNAGDLSILALCIVCSNLPAASSDEYLHSQLHPLH